MHSSVIIIAIASFGLRLVRKFGVKIHTKMRNTLETALVQLGAWLRGEIPLEGPNNKSLLSEAEMESFLHESLEQASILQPYFANPRDSSSAASIDSEIRSGFKEYRDKKKFCSVNTKRTLEEHPWRQFFVNL